MDTGVLHKLRGVAHGGHACSAALFGDVPALLFGELFARELDRAVRATRRTVVLPLRFFIGEEAPRPRRDELRSRLDVSALHFVAGAALARLPVPTKFPRQPLSPRCNVRYPNREEYEACCALRWHQRRYDRGQTTLSPFVPGPSASASTSSPNTSIRCVAPAPTAPESARSFVTRGLGTQTHWLCADGPPAAG